MNVNVLEILGVVFVVLKLIGAIAWPWWAVLLPFIVMIGVYAIAHIIIWLGLKNVFGKHWWRLTKW